MERSAYKNLSESADKVIVTILKTSMIPEMNSHTMDVISRTFKLESGLTGSVCVKYPYSEYMLL